MLRLTDDEIEIVAICSVRYALGRQTYIVGEVCSMLAKLKPHLKQERVKQLVEEIEEAVGGNRAGGESDVVAWRGALAVLRAPAKPEPAKAGARR